MKKLTINKQRNLTDKLLFGNFLLILVSLSFGQLSRLEFAKVTFYPHDVLIGLFILGSITEINLNYIKRLLSKFEWRRWWLEIVFLVWLGFNLVYQVSLKNNFLPLLYDLRTFYYASFSFLLYRQLKRWQTKPWYRHWPWFLLIISFLAVFGLIQYRVFYDIRSLLYIGWDEHLGRLVSTLLDPNFVGFLLALGLVYWQSWRRRLTQWQWWLGNLVFITSLTLTFSRASYLVAGIGLMVALFITKTVKTRWLSGITLGLLIAGIILVPKPPGEGGKLLRTASIKARIVNDLQVIVKQQQIQNSEFGLTALRHPSQENSTLVIPRRGTQFLISNSKSVSHARQPNNLEVLVIQQIGWFGLGFFLILLLKWSKRFWQQNHLVGIMLLMLFIHAQFNNTAFEPFVFLIFWGVIGEILRFELDV